MSRLFTNGIDLDGAKIINLGDPSSDTDAASKSYVDAVAEGRVWKESVRAKSTTNIDVSSAPATIDGVTMATGDRLLLADQTTVSENGLWTYQGSGSALTRPADWASGSTQTPGSTVTVTEGSTHSDTQWHVTSDSDITVDTDGQTWSLAAGAQRGAGNGLQLNGNDLEVQASDSSIVVASGGISVEDSIRSKVHAESIGDGSSTNIAVTHSFGTKDVIIQLYDTSTDDDVTPDVTRTDTNSVTFHFNSAPSSNAYRAVIKR